MILFLVIFLVSSPIIGNKFPTKCTKMDACSRVATLNSHRNNNLIPILINSSR